jgi:hypothetical protein
MMMFEESADAAAELGATDAPAELGATDAPAELGATDVAGAAADDAGADDAGADDAGADAPPPLHATPNNAIEAIAPTNLRPRHLWWS